MKARHLIGACALCVASAVQGEAHFHPAVLARLPPGVTAEPAAIDAWTIGQTIGYMLFSPGKVHEVWPDYGYELEKVKQADLCTAAMLSSQSDFWLGDVSLIVKADPPEKYQGFALYPMAEMSYGMDYKTFHWEGVHLDKSGLESWELTLGDLCQWLEGAAYSQILAATLNSEGQEVPPKDLLIVTDRVIPDVNLKFHDRYEIQLAPNLDQWSKVLQSWEASDTSTTQAVEPTN